MTEYLVYLPRNEVGEPYSALSLPNQEDEWVRNYNYRGERAVLRRLHIDMPDGGTHVLNDLAMRVPITLENLMRVNFAEFLLMKDDGLTSWNVRSFFQRCGKIGPKYEIEMRKRISAFTAALRVSRMPTLLE